MSSDNDLEEQVNWTDLLGWGEEQLDDLRVTGYFYIRQGKYDIALSFFKALIVLDPENLYDKQALGALYLQLGKLSKALTLFNKAIKIDPNHLPTLLNKAKALLELGRRVEGIKLAKKLAKKNDEDIASSARALIMAYS
ncbi:MAG: tetratricopeptide repeat protein [Chlamydiota bacterium]